MKKNLFVLGAVAAIMVSCGGPSDEEMGKAAQMMCDCVEQKRAEADPEDMFATDDMHFAFCALDVAVEHGVNCGDDAFAKALDAKCSDLNELQKEYAKNAQ
jgi:hypothetical protein